MLFVLKPKAALLLVVLFFLFAGETRGQTYCNDCSIVISTNTTYVSVDVGENVCILEGVECDEVYMNGGTLCNEGTIYNLNLYGASGEVNNYNYILVHDATVRMSGNLSINNRQYGVLEFNTQILRPEGYLFYLRNYTTGTINFYEEITCNYGGNVQIENGVFGDDPLYEPAYLNFSSHYNSNASGLSITNNEYGYLNFYGSLNLSSSPNKEIINYGIFNVYESFNLATDGSSTYLSNYGLFAIEQNFNAVYTDEGGGYFEFLNTNTFSTAYDTYINGYEFVWTNYGEYSTSSLETFGISIDNSGTFNTGVTDLRSGTVYSNNKIHNASTLTLYQYASATNNGYINSSVLNNQSTLSLTNQSAVRTATYVNSGVAASISAPTTATSSANYARILVSGYSQNTSTITGKILVFDKSLSTTTANIGYGFDAITTPSLISSNVLFGAKTSTSGSGPPVVDCSALSTVYFLTTNTPPVSTCAGSIVTLTAQMQETVNANGTVITNSYAISSSNYTWQAVNVNYQNTNVTPSVTTNYTVYATLITGCVLSKTVSVTVNPSPAPTISYTGSPFTYSNTTSATFSVTRTGPSGGTYTFTPTGLSLNASTGVITASASSFGTYTVYYTTPESGACYSLYTASTVVVLNNLACNVSISPGYGSLCVGDQILIVASGGIDGYTWTPSSGLSCTNCASPVITYSGSPNSYTVISTRSGSVCGSSHFVIEPRNDCEDNTIIGCCFSNYGAAVYVNDANTHINIYCNVLNEVSNLITGPSVSKGRFESYGHINFTKDWIHNGQNTLYTTSTGTAMTFGSIDQNLKGNSNTHFNTLITGGNGLRTIWINEFTNSDLDLTSNELVIQNYVFYMKGAGANVYRTSGFASTGVNGYFSRYMGSNTANPYKTYLFPLGTRASTVIPFRYRPLEMMNNNGSQADEVSANFMNTSPSLTNDYTFINANPTYTNVVTDKAPSVSQVNNNYYHKIKNTVLPVSPPSNLIIRSYYPALDGSYQSLAEWEKNLSNTLDWWGTTPGASANSNISNNAGTFGQMYAAMNGTVGFDGRPFSLAISNVYVNTTSFGGSPGTVITLTPAPTNTTSISTNTSTEVTSSGTVTVVNTTTTTINGGGVTSTTSSYNGTVTTITTNTTTVAGGITTSTMVVTTGTNVTVVTSSASTGPGGVITTTTSSASGTVTSVTTSSTSPTIGGVSSSTVVNMNGGTTTTTLSNTVNNGNTSTTTSSVTTVTGASTVVVTQTCVTNGVGNSAITTCSNQTVGNPSITVVTTTATTVGSNTTAANTYTNVYGPGPIALSPNPAAGDYILNISNASNCDIPGQVKFTVTPGGTISPTSIMYAPASSNNFSVNLSEDLYSIDNASVSLTLNSTPKDILAQCANSVSIISSVNSDYVMDKTVSSESISISVPFTATTGLSLGSFNVYDGSGNPIPSYTPASLSLGSNNVNIGHTSLPVGVYSFAFNMSFTLPSGPVTETIKGQFIIK